MSCTPSHAVLQHLQPRGKLRDQSDEAHSVSREGTSSGCGCWQMHWLSWGNCQTERLGWPCVLNLKYFVFHHLILQTANGIIPKFDLICLLNLRYLKQIWSGSNHAGYIFQSCCYSNYCLDLFPRLFLISKDIALPRYRNLINMFILRACSLLATTRSTGTTPETFGASTTSQWLLGLGTVRIRKRLATLIHLGFGNAPSLGFHGIYGRHRGSGLIKIDQCCDWRFCLVVNAQNV